MFVICLYFYIFYKIPKIFITNIRKRISNHTVLCLSRIQSKFFLVIYEYKSKSISYSHTLYTLLILGTIQVYFRWNVQLLQFKGLAVYI